MSECDSPASDSPASDSFRRFACWRFIGRWLDVSRAVRLWVLSPGEQISRGIVPFRTDRDCGY